MTIEVALAFESGGDPAECARTLAALREAGVRATIFLDGRWAEANPFLVQTIAADGHELGNHAYNHLDCTLLGDEEIAAELARTDGLALRLAGRSTKPWFRPPYQRLDDRVRRIAGQKGYRCLSRDALDGAHYLGPSTPEAIRQRSEERATDGAVLTYHLQNPHTAQVLPEIVARLRRVGARLVTIGELAAVPTERAPLHPDFAGLNVDPGYLRMHRPAPPPQMVNLLALGADAQAPVDRVMPVGTTPRGTIHLLVFNGRETLHVVESGPLHVTCLAGEVVLQATDAEALVCTAVARPGDTLEVREGWGLRADPAGGGRAILLVMA